METIVALLAAVYGGYLLWSGNQTGLTPIELVKGGGISLIGLLWAIYSQKDNILAVGANLMKKLPKNTTSPTITQNKVVVDEDDFTPDNIEQKDFECLNHLRKRVTKANSKEGIDTCSKLNDIIFNLEFKAGEKA